MRKSKYQIWNKGKLYNVYKSRPAKTPVEKLSATTAEERKIGIKYIAVNNQ